MLNPLKIRKITKSNYSGFLYNLAVENDETFVVNGVVVHNCRCTVRALTEYDLNKAAIIPEIMPDGQLKYSFGKGVVEDGNKVLAQLKSEGLQIDKGFDYMPCDLRQITQQAKAIPKIDASKQWLSTISELKQYRNISTERDYIKYVEKLKASESAFEDYVKYLNQLEETELKIARRELIDRVLKTDASFTAQKRQEAINKIVKGTSHISNRLMADLERSGIKYEFMNTETSSFSAVYGQVKLRPTADYEVIAHETGHAIDALMSSGGKGFYSLENLRPADRMGLWINTPYVTEKEALEYKKWFSQQKTGVKLKYTNGKGEFWEGDWISDYEGRIYEGSQGFGEQFWAVNSQRYSEYKNFNFGKLRQYSQNEFGLDVIGGGNKVVNGELIPYTKKEAFEELNKKIDRKIASYARQPKELAEPMILNLEKGKEVLNKLYAYGNGDKTDADWLARKLTSWGKASERYPEFTKFIEKFYSRELA